MFIPYPSRDSGVSRFQAHWHCSAPLELFRICVSKCCLFSSPSLVFLSYFWPFSIFSLSMHSVHGVTHGQTHHISIQHRVVRYSSGLLVLRTFQLVFFLWPLSSCCCNCFLHPCRRACEFARAHNRFQFNCQWLRLERCTRPGWKPGSRTNAYRRDLLKDVIIAIQRLKPWHPRAQWLEAAGCEPCGINKSEQFGSTLQQRLKPPASATITCSAGNTTPTNTATTHYVARVGAVPVRWQGASCMQHGLTMRQCA